MSTIYAGHTIVALRIVLYDALERYSFEYDFATTGADKIEAAIRIWAINNLLDVL